MPPSCRWCTTRTWAPPSGRWRTTAYGNDTDYATCARTGGFFDFGFVFLAILGFTIRQMAHQHRSEDMETTILQMTKHRPMQPFFVQHLGHTIG